MMCIHTCTLIIYRSTQRAKFLFEELISRQSRDIMKGSPLLWRHKGNGKPVGQQRVKERKPRAKPNSVIQKLLEKFDPLKLNSANAVQEVKIHS